MTVPTFALFPFSWSSHTPTSSHHHTGKPVRLTTFLSFASNRVCCTREKKEGLENGQTRKLRQYFCSIAIARQNWRELERKRRMQTQIKIETCIIFYLRSTLTQSPQRAFLFLLRLRDLRGRRRMGSAEGEGRRWKYWEEKEEGRMGP